MKWALIILAFIATTYFFTSRAGKKEFERGRRIEQIKQEQKKRESIAQASKSSALKFSEKTIDKLAVLPNNTIVQTKGR